MKRTIKWASLVLIAGLLIYLAIFLSRTLPILSAYNAKVMCSCVFVAGRDQQRTEREELGVFPFTLASNHIDFGDSSVVSEVFGVFKRKSIYRKGWGCTLLNGIAEKELRKQSFLASTIVTDSIKSQFELKEGDTTTKDLDHSLLETTVDDAFKEPLKDSLRRTRAVVVLYDGKIVAEKYADGFDKNSILPGWSMTKSIINAWIGILLKQQKIKLQSNHLFPEWESDDRMNITLDNLLHDNSGLHWEENYRKVSPATKMLFQKGAMGSYAMSLSLEFPPGGHFEYSSGTTNIISVYLRRLLGDTVYYQFPYHEIFFKIGMYSAILEDDAYGNYVGSSYCFATARDWAKFGLLYLNDGVWNGERILPEGWVNFSASPKENSPLRQAGRYGAHFWLNTPDSAGKKAMPDVPSDCFRANGYEGQNIFIIPSKKLVIVKLGLEHDAKARLDVNRFVAGIIKATNSH